jgi:CRISPR system Cascade subunit CasA
MSYSFNLLEQPWIPCLTPQGTTVSLSLRDAFARAHDLRGITHESPLVAVSALRLLLAVLHRIHGPRNAAAWAALWRASSFDIASFDPYFDQWRNRFDLFDVERPFYQDASIPQDRAVPVSKLMHAAASGNNATLFDHSLDGGCPAITAAEAALQLLVNQTFAIGGLITPDPSISNSKSAEGSPTVKGALCLVRGENLFQTLLLNLRRYAPAQEVPFGSAADTPAWERAESAKVRERVPSGWLDLLTWQSRRILLLPEGDTTAPTVRKAALMKGEAVSTSFALQGKDSMMAWQLLEKASKDTNPWIPLSFREERAVWRDAHCLFGNFADQSVRPPVLDWICDLTDETLDERCRHALDIAGLCTFQAKILSWHSESLPLPLAILKTPALYGQVKKALEMAEEGQSAIARGARRLAERLLAPQESVQGKKKDADKETVTHLSNSLLRLQHYWSPLQIEFQKFIVDLAAKGSESIDPDTGSAPAMCEWIRQCRRSARECMDITCRAAGQGDRSFRAVAEAEAEFHKLLNQKLPDPKTKKEVVENDAAIAG